jgi:predicted DNA-binding antitoxin AbrB/MazE fold protein
MSTVQAIYENGVFRPVGQVELDAATRRTRVLDGVRHRLQRDPVDGDLDCGGQLG